MPIYEYACPRCRKVFSFFSKTLTPPRQPNCPQCGLENLEKVLSRFSAPRGVQEPSGKAEGEEPMLSAADEARMEAVMGELERDMDHIDENNPKHLAYMMKRMKDAMPPGMMPKEFDEAMKRLEKGESPEKIEEEMGDIFGMDEEGGAQERGGLESYSHDSGLYDY